VSEWSLRDITIVSLLPPEVYLWPYPNPTVGILTWVQDIAKLTLPCRKKDEVLFKILWVVLEVSLKLLWSRWTGMSVF
jgi:hypothetical protein